MRKREWNRSEHWIICYKQIPCAIHRRTAKLTNAKRWRVRDHIYIRLRYARSPRREGNSWRDAVSLCELHCAACACTMGSQVYTEWYSACIHLLPLPLIAALCAALIRESMHARANTLVHARGNFHWTLLDTRRNATTVTYSVHLWICEYNTNIQLHTKIRVAKRSRSLEIA